MRREFRVECLLTSSPEARHSQSDPDRQRENGKASRIGWGVDRTLEDTDVKGRWSG